MLETSITQNCYFLDKLSNGKWHGDDTMKTLENSHIVIQHAEREESSSVDMP
jgi:hypothetical protein